MLALRGSNPPPFCSLAPVAGNDKFRGRLFKLAKACGESCVPLMLLQERLDADTLHAAELLDGVRSCGPLACMHACLLLLPCCCLLVASVPDDCAFARVCMPEQCSPCAQSGSSRNRRKLCKDARTCARAREHAARTHTLTPAHRRHVTHMLRLPKTLMSRLAGSEHRCSTSRKSTI